MSSKIDIKLFKAAIEPWSPGAIQKIKDYCAEGANPNFICKDASTARGPVVAGSSLLTHSVHQGSSRAVEALLECGADPNLKDQLGWTPWMASGNAVSKRERIQELLKEYGAEIAGDHIAKLCHAIYDGNIETAYKLLTSADDLKLLTEFRVDLVGHQILSKRPDMLRFLLENGMPFDESQLYRSVRERYAPAVKLFLAHGVDPDRAGDDETILMLAASLGDIEIVKMLVEAGANVDAYSNDNIEWTAAFYAQKSKHKEVATWLESKMSAAFIAKQQERMSSRNPKFQALYKNATSAEGLSTDDIVGVLQDWDQRFGVTIKHSDTHSVSILFETSPDNLAAFFAEVVKLCPALHNNKKASLGQFADKKTIDLFWY